MSTFKDLVEANESVWKQIEDTHRNHVIKEEQLLKGIVPMVPEGVVTIIVEYSQNEGRVDALHGVKALYDRIEPFQFMFHKGLDLDTITHHFGRLQLDMTDDKCKQLMYALELFDSVQLMAAGPVLTPQSRAYEPELTMLKLQSWRDLGNESVRNADDPSLDTFFHNSLVPLISWFDEFRDEDIAKYVLIGEVCAHFSSVTHGFILWHKETGCVYGFDYCTVAGHEEQFERIAHSFIDWIRDCGSNYCQNLRQVSYETTANKTDYVSLYRSGDKDKFTQNTDLWEKAIEYAQRPDEPPRKKRKL
eukprot:82552_1